MKDNMQDLRAIRRSSSQDDRGHGSTKHALFLCLALAIFGVGRQWSRSQKDSTQNEPPISDAVATPTQAGGAEATATGGAPPEDVIEVREAEPAAPATPRKVEILSRGAAALPAHTPRTEPTPLARQLVTSLTQFDFSRGPLAAEQAAQWKGSLQQLIQQGGDAVPAIQEFLELNRDWDFGAVNPLGYPSLRAACLDALDQIGGPEAQELLRKTLQTTAVPSEIARVSRSLERQAPGQFLDEIRTAVRETLAQAAAGRMPGWDMGPLFQVSQDYGNANTVADLEKSASKWNYYAALALANVPSGAGLPTLVRLARESTGTGTRGAAVEALAQVAPQYPLAGEALVELARSGQLSDKNWIAAAAALEGIRYLIRDNGLDSALVPVGAGVKSYYLARSNQHFYSAPAWGGMSTGQIQQRIKLIDQLLAVSPNAAVAQALQNARASLLASGQHASVDGISQERQ